MNQFTVWDQIGAVSLMLLVCLIIIDIDKLMLKCGLISKYRLHRLREWYNNHHPIFGLLTVSAFVYPTAILIVMLANYILLFIYF
jgi:ABC-type multidrug transport system permease subunit